MPPSTPLKMETRRNPSPQLHATSPDVGNFMPLANCPNFKPHTDRFTRHAMYV